MGKYNYEQGPKPSEDRELSETPWEKEFNKLMDDSSKENPVLFGILHEIDRKSRAGDSGMKKMLESALSSKGKSWRDMETLGENPEAVQVFSHLISFWNDPVDGRPKTDEDRFSEASRFAKLL